MATKSGRLTGRSSFARSVARIGPLEERQRRIRAWMDAHPFTPKPSTPEIDEAIATAHLAIDSFAAAYDRVRVAVVAAKKTR